MSFSMDNGLLILDTDASDETIGSKFIVMSDHESLKWLYSLKKPQHRIAR